ncbi:MAG TPA: DUF1707 domain-containing protein [Acidimicrobiales bacterium]|jgi:hypothetical protein|nr:DUF1707 domain-containing protein [Acidimicrobiales bacterium]
MEPEPQAGGELRASDADRERVAEVLRQHCVAGRLDPEEYAERLEAALSARTLPALFAVTADLPHPDAVTPAPKPPARRRRWAVVERLLSGRK